MKALNDSFNIEDIEYRKNKLLKLNVDIDFLNENENLKIINVNMNILLIYFI